MREKTNKFPEKIRVKDKRKGMFLVDNVILNGHGKALGATGIAFYVTLCRYANNQTQQCYPSLTTIQNETSMDRKTIISAAQRAEKLGLIKKRVFPGKYTLYTLLEPTSGKSTLVEKAHSSGGKSTHKRTKIERTKNINNQHKADYRDKKSTVDNSFRLKSGFKKLDELLGRKRVGAAYKWQDFGARMAKSLGFTPGKAWFKFIRDNYQNKKALISSTYSQIADIEEVRNPEKYFYKVFHNNK